MEFNNQILVLTQTTGTHGSMICKCSLMHYGCWQLIIQTKPEQPDEEATFYRATNLQMERRGTSELSKIEAELILEANRLQLMKQDLRKENAYLSSFTRRSRKATGATAAAHGDPNGKNDYQKKGGKVENHLGIASKTFGCLAYAGCQKQIRKKIDMREKMGIMMGYAQRTKDYRIWLIDENKLVETIN
ncbi:uncharacterized protein TNCV_178081, partial [Trichonephila clavipes]